MTTYKQFTFKDQVGDFEVSPPEQVAEFWRRLPDRDASREIIRSIALEWLTGCYDEVKAVNLIRELDLCPIPERLEPYRAMRVIARAEYGKDVELPDPPDDTPPAAALCSETPENTKVISAAHHREFAA